MADNLQRASSGFFRSLLMTRAERVSERSRGIHNYKPNSFAAFLTPEQGVFNLAVSGGSVMARSNIICEQIESARQNRLPVVVLHEGNRVLEDTVYARFGGCAEFALVSRRSPAFEPVQGLVPLEIANEFIQTATRDYDIKYNARYYLDGVTEIMGAMGKKPSFKMFATCPHLQIFDKVDALQMQGKITDPQAQAIRSKLMMGQTENLKLDSFLSSLQMEMEPILWKSGSSLAPVNIYSAIRDRKILILDVPSVNSVMLMNMLVYQMNLAATRGMLFTLVLDTLPVNANPKYEEFLKRASSNIAWTLVSDDLYATLGGDERIFNAAVGNSLTTVVMTHSSGRSAMKWAETIGMCDVWNDSYSNSITSQSSPTSFFNTYSSTNGHNTNKSREFIVRPEAISRMQPGEAFIISSLRHEIAHLFLTA